MVIYAGFGFVWTGRERRRLTSEGLDGGRRLHLM
jgi:hypothetical protein